MLHSPVPDVASPPATEPWHVALLGGLRAERGDQVLTRFRSQNYGALLAFLALNPNRTYAREELAERFWPDSDPDVARANLRTALASLRRQLEPPGTPPGSVLVSTSQHQVGVSSDTLHTDVVQFDALVKAAARADASPDDKRRRLEEAALLYAGPLLPGLYDAWVLTERDRLSESYRRVLQTLSKQYQADGNFDLALDYARRAVSTDPTDEDAHTSVIRLLMQTGQTAAARRHFEELTRILDDQLGVQPSAKTRALLTATYASRPTAPVPAASLPHADAATEPVVAAPSTTPPTSAAPPLHLPSTGALFFGREDEIAALGALLTAPHVRLVTLTGPGGSGKTRLAIKTAESVATDFDGGIYWASLADVREPERIADVIASALGLELAPGAPLGQITSALNALPGPALLLLDNAEHLVDAVAPLLSQLLQQAPRLVSLVTSRQRLLLDAEHEFPLLPLSTPRHSALPESLMEFPCVQLFVHRAQVSRADFQLTSHNAKAVTALCARLEGLPLALELAAAWSRTLTPTQMLERMDQRFDLLVSRRRDISPRHRSLRATIEASVELLEPDLRTFFHQLYVFRDGWTLEAAEAVTGELRATEFLEVLQEHSLLFTPPPAEMDDTPRFHMLESLREFASESLSADEKAQLAARHATFFDDLMEAGASPLFGPNQAQWIRRLSRENDNLLAMLDTYDSPEGAEAGLRITGRMWRYWSMSGGLSEGRRRFARALARDDGSAPCPLRARARYGASVLAQLQGDYREATEYAQASLALWREEGIQERVADVLTHLAIIETNRSDYAKALQHLQEATAFNRTIGDPGRLALSLNNLAACLLEWGKLDEAVLHLQECLPLARTAGMQHVEACALFNLGTIRHDQKNLAAARPLYEQSAEMRRYLGDKHSLGQSLELLGTLALDEGNAEESLRHLAESLALRRDMQDLAGMCDVQYSRSMACLKLGNRPEAQSALNESLTLAERLESHWRIARGLEVFGRLASTPARAVRLWGAARAIRAAHDAPLPPHEQQALDAQISQARAMLGEKEFTKAWQFGHATPRTAILDFACSISLR